MTSLVNFNEESTTLPPTVKKKKKACTKRRILRPQDNFESSNIYSVSNIRQNPFQLSLINGDSDEEENVEQFQAKLNARINKSGKPSGSKKSKTRNTETVPDDEEDILHVSTPEATPSKLPSPSPPPPPPLELERPRNKRLDKTVRNLDKAYHNAVSMQDIQQKSTPTSGCSDQSQSFDVDLDNSFEIAQNRREMAVKVRTKHGLKRFTLGMDEPLIKIILSLAAEDDVDVNKLSLTCNAEQLNEGETPASLQLKVTDILDCVVIDPSSVPLEDISDLIPDEDKVDIKFQGEEKKSVFNFKLPKDEMFKRALEAYSKFLSTPLEELKFWFDGEGVSPMDTPESLDMEEQATIDVTRR
ncbi:NFATC2-interacting protein-like isoform X1 [Apostichopus japonicus]|uniref:NFATC2-interacting protein-like isoform X1 n=1 Tax=Stichopus japonicus TaxID=307972 RepID=UPI003AB4C07D